MRSIRSDSREYLLSAAILGLVAGDAWLVRIATDLQAEMAHVRQAVVADVGHLKDATLAAADAAQQQLETLRGGVQSAKLQTAAAADQARRDAQKRADVLAQDLRQQARQQQDQVADELTNIRAVAVAAHAALGDLSGELRDKREEVAAARSGIEQANVAGGGASAGLAGFSEYVAAHGRELAAMRHRRERNVMEFALAKSAAPQNVGGLALRLRRADPRHNTYTLEVSVSGRTLEQRDRGLNEPVRFYLTGTRQPYELVVNQIGKDEVRGYLAAPRTTQIATN